MANQNDSFIDEVTEELRRDRLFHIMRRFGWVVVLVILIVVGGTAWYEMSRKLERENAMAFGDAVLGAAEADDPAAALAGIGTQGAPGREAVRALLEAAALVEQDQQAEAATLLRDQAATIGGANPLLRDLMLLKAVIAAGPHMNAAERDSILSGLSQAGAPFELLALELKAIALVDAGREDDAVTLIRQILRKDGLSESLRLRLTELMITLGAEPEPVAAPDQAVPATAAN